jgi:hypothetical protein
MNNFLALHVWHGFSDPLCINLIRALESWAAVCSLDDDVLEADLDPLFFDLDALCKFTLLVFLLCRLELLTGILVLWL